MAALINCCVLLIVCVSLTHAAVDNPCNDQYKDCEAGECCATTVGAPDGFSGLCQKYKHFNEACTPGKPLDGECGCVRSMICATFEFNGPESVTHSCQIILPGR